MFFRMKMNINHHNNIINYSRLYHHMNNDEHEPFDKNNSKTNDKHITSSKVFYGIYNQEPSIIGKLLLRPKSPLIFMQ